MEVADAVVTLASGVSSASAALDLGVIQAF
jgi:hypothetical protein